MKILYATDGSEGALDAARFLDAAAHRDDMHVHILTIPASNQRDDEKAAEKILLNASQTLRAFPGRVTSEVGRPGNTNSQIAERIVECASGLPADMILVGTHGRSAVTRWFLGSVALRVTREALCPVLVARSPHGPLDRILAGVDGSAYSENAVRWMLKNLAVPAFSTVRLLGIVTLSSLISEQPFVSSNASTQIPLLLEHEENRLQEMLTRLSGEIQTPTLNITTDVRLGNAAGGLLAAAEDWQADLLTVGSHGVSGMERWLLGSVSEAVLQRAPCSVLVVR